MTAGESIVVGNPSEGSRTRAIEYLEDGGVSVRNWDNGCRPSVSDLQALALDPGSAKRSTPVVTFALVSSLRPIHRLSSVITHVSVQFLKLLF